MGSQTGLPSSPGSLTAYSTTLRLPSRVATSRAYCSGARISSRIAPSCSSPSIPRVLTFESTRLRSPTPEASACISPRPRYTCSSRSLTAENERAMRSSSVCCSFSSTTRRISASCRPFSCWMSESRRSVVSRIPSSFCSFSSAKEFNRSSIWLCTAITARCKASCRCSSRAPASCRLCACILAA